MVARTDRADAQRVVGDRERDVSLAALTLSAAVLGVVLKLTG
jgi:hypothetical protein